MTLREILDHVDRVKPNAFSDEDKVLWLNELEYAVQTDVLGRLDGFYSHTLTDAWRGEDITILDDHTLAMTGKLAANPGGRASLIGVSPGTAFAGAEILAVSEADGETVLTLPAGTLPSIPGVVVLHVPYVYNERQELVGGGITVQYDGCTEAMLVPAPYQKVYPAYLEARIDAANGEWNEYDNAMALCNGFLGEYQRWYARSFLDDPETR